MYSESHWRNVAYPIIRDVLDDYRVHGEKALRKALRDAYPFGERKYHPYKIWLDEIARQRGLKPKLGTFGKKARERQLVADERQEKLF